MSSLVTPDASTSLLTCPGSFSRTLIFDDFWWISGVLMRRETFAPPLPLQEGMPQVIRPRFDHKRWIEGLSSDVIESCYALTSAMV